eukprot:scaffold400708_cov19-Prasinocladus_malaysianus.AAC.1
MKSDTIRDGRQVLEYLLDVLKEYNLANVRQYPEIMAVHLVSRVPALLDSHMLPALRTYEVRHEGLTSYVLIAAQVGAYQCCQRSPYSPPIR